MCQLLLLVDTWNCWISYKSRYAKSWYQWRDFKCIMRYKFIVSREFFGPDFMSSLIIFSQSSFFVVPPKEMFSSISRYLYDSPSLTYWIYKLLVLIFLEFTFVPPFQFRDKHIYILQISYLYPLRSVLQDLVTISWYFYLGEITLNCLKKKQMHNVNFFTIPFSN